MNTKILYIYKLMSALLPESRAFWLKNVILRWAGAKVGKDVRIYSSTLVMGNGRIEIGDDVFIGPRCILAASGGAVLKLAGRLMSEPCVTSRRGPI